MRTGWNRLACLACLVVTSVSLAQAPQAAGVRYPLTENEGPWLIHVASFRGDDALNFANNLSEELRAKHRLSAFVFSMEDPSAKQDAEALKRQQLRLAGADKAHGSDERLRFKTVRVLKEYSVFVGNYPDMKEARIAAAKIKEFDPPSCIPAFGLHFYKEPTERVRVDPAENNEFGIFGFRLPTKEVKGEKKDQQQGNPYRQAFVVRNPLRPQQQVVRQPSEIDPSWRLLNAKERYSIFTCPKSWTIVVAVFQPPNEVLGATSPVVQAGHAQSYGKHLEYAADQARKLADLLRDGGRGYDAYVFHTTTCSIVTVGSFESRTDPNMKAAWEALVAFAATQNDGPYACLKKVPQPMQVPGR